MKSKFNIFYKPSEEEHRKIWDDSIFVLDTNILLNLYRYTDTTRNELINILEKLNKRVWIPHQVAMEYHFNRSKVIVEQQVAYQQFIKAIKETSDESISFFKEKVKKLKKRHKAIDIKDIETRIRNEFNSIKNDLEILENEHPNLQLQDTILDEITRLFEEKVGEAYTQEKLDEIFKEGQKRYEASIPPGYEDEKDKKGKKKYFQNLIIEDMYGDLIIWNQIMDHAIDNSSSIIFITDDSKEDWWLEISGKTIGPRIELINEFSHRTGYHFTMYNTEKFIEYAMNYLEESINQQVINEVHEVRNENRFKNIGNIEAKIKQNQEFRKFMQRINRATADENYQDDISYEQDNDLFFDNEMYEDKLEEIGATKEFVYKVGDVIYHSKWKVGIVEDVMYENGNEIIIVDFPNLGIKRRLLAEYSPIEKLNKED